MIPNFSVTMMVLLPLVLSTILSASATVAGNLRSRSAAHNTVAKRIRGDLSLIDSLFTGTRWTFYDAGLGACGETNTENDFIVALNAIQFGLGYPGPECFKTITMKYNGKSATAKIMDMCPVCPYGGLDLSRGLFRFFAEEDQGVIYGEWHFGSEDDESYGRYSGPPEKTTSKPQTPTRVVVHRPQQVFPNPSSIRGPNRPTNKPEVTRASQPYPWHGSPKERPQVDSRNTSLPSPSLMPTPSTTLSQGGSKNSTALNGTALASGTTTMPATSSNATSSPKASMMEGSGGPHSENLAALNEILRNLGSIIAASHA